jgi:uncharacterized repeat protein (TIGR01451 family)
MRLTYQLVITSLILIISLVGTSKALEYCSYIFTTEDIIFFSYENETHLEVYNSSGNSETVDPNVLDKGEHVIVNTTQGIYKVCGSNKFTVLTGDPATAGDSGYYAMDANGLGTSREFYTYVPQKNPAISGTQQFIVFGYQHNTGITVQQDVGNGDYEYIASFTLNEGQHWENPGLSDKYIHVIADKPVSALTCHAEGYFVPSDNGRWSGTEFYTYVGDIQHLNQDLTVIAYDNDTSVTINDTNDPNIVIWSGTLNYGKAYVESFPHDKGQPGQYVTITSSKPITVSVQPWVSYQSNYLQGLFIPDRDGTGIGRMGRDLIGSTLNDGYLYILAHTDDTRVELYNSENGSWEASYALNEGEAENANPGNGLWRIVSDRYVSAYSGFGTHTAEFAPLAFDAKPGLLYLNKIAEFEGTCVMPGDEITYTITYGPNGFDHNNVFIIDYLPPGVTYDEVNWETMSVDPNYDPNRHTYKWQIGPLDANAPNDSVTLKVKVNGLADPLGTLVNRCEIESDIAYSTAEVNTPVCCWCGDIIYVDQDANGFNNGTSWLDAFTDLQDALNTPRTCGFEQIWVAQGTYLPTSSSDTGARVISFELLDGIAIYGGFAGTESDPNQRDLTDPNNETILSGDIGTPVDQNDNSYHVVKCVDVNNAVLDGFTITAGNANGSVYTLYSGGGMYCQDSNDQMVTNCTFIGNSAVVGGGLYNSQSSPTLINCTFCGNLATTSEGDTFGGGICNYLSSPTLINCAFSGNSATTGEYYTKTYGGAICNWYDSDPNITNCTFSGNSATATGYGLSYGGAIYNWNDSNPNLINCIFSGNFASTEDDSYGGAICNWDDSNPNLINCTFSGNSATTTGDYTNTYGGAVCNWNDSDPYVTNCLFSNNSALEGGAVYNYYHSVPNITNCLFSNNSAWDGGAVYNADSDPYISNCIFTGNIVEHHGGGMYNYDDSNTSVANSIFSGNRAIYYGGGIANLDNSNLTLTNCTISENWAHIGGGICSWIDVDTNLTNCILWDNDANTSYEEIYSDLDSYPVISYSNIRGWTETINEDPCFFEVDSPTGSWSADASYDESTFQSTLTNTGASWTVNQLAGKFINPDTVNQDLHFFIVSNDVNTINVWSNVESFVTSGDFYQIYDYHLKVESPCIDAGDPQGDYNGQKDIDGEPRVFDGDYNDSEIVDMGADEYYWSPADFNSDGLVNFFDYAFFASAWQSDPNDPNYNEDCDLEDNNSIDSKDLARFCEDWLWQTAWAKTFPFAYETMGHSMGRSMAESPGLTQDLFVSVSAKQAQPELTAADIEEIIKWLEQLWLTDDQVRKVISEDDWLKFIELVKDSI